MQTGYILRRFDSFKEGEKSGQGFYANGTKKYSDL
jgi:hypothetical protein